jgi:hypothetical protein
MTFISNIITKVDNFFVPHDGLRDQAAELIADYDGNGDSKIDVGALQEDKRAALPGFFGTAVRSFAGADEAGNGNGSASLREVRNLLKTYDTGDGTADTTGNKHLEGVELLHFTHDFAAPRPTQGPSQSVDGVTQLAA